MPKPTPRNGDAIESIVGWMSSLCANCTIECRNGMMHLKDPCGSSTIVLTLAEFALIHNSLEQLLRRFHIAAAQLTTGLPCSPTVPPIGEHSAPGY